jgi:hypothetical protein
LTTPPTSPAAKTESRKPKTRLAHLLLPQLDANSALLPPDRWILRTAMDIVRRNESFHSTIGRAAAYAGGGFAALAAGGVAAVLLAATLPLVGTLAIASASLGAAVFAGVKARQYVQRFKSDTLPLLRGEIGKKYLEYKAGEIKAAWQRNLDKRRQKQAEKKSAAKPVETAPAEKPPQKPVAEKKPQNPASNAGALGKSLGDAFGAWAKKKAEERAKKTEQKPPDAPPKP